MVFEKSWLSVVLSDESEEHNNDKEERCRKEMEGSRTRNVSHPECNATEMTNHYIHVIWSGVCRNIGKTQWKGMIGDLAAASDMQLYDSALKLWESSIIGSRLSILEMHLSGGGISYFNKPGWRTWVKYLPSFCTSTDFFLYWKIWIANIKFMPGYLFRDKRNSYRCRLRTIARIKRWQNPYGSAEDPKH